MKRLETTNLFHKGLKRMKKRGKQPDKLTEIINCLQTDVPLPHSARPHKLSGEWAGFWECHIEGDWLLVYEFDEQMLRLHATGTHQDLFKSY